MNSAFCPITPIQMKLCFNRDRSKDKWLSIQ